MSSPQRPAPPGHTRQLLIWELTHRDDLREIRTGLHRFFEAVTPEADSDQDDVAQRIALVATELAGNALRHGLPPIVVRLLRDAGSYILDVSDHAPDRAPDLAAPRQHIHAGGRGLLIAGSLAKEVCWYQGDHVKHIWASFPAPAARPGTPHFTIALRAEPGGTLRVGLTGEFDTGVGGALAGALVDAARRPGISRVIVDLEHTRLIDSHAVAGLVSGYEAAIAAGRAFTVINGRGLVQQVLDITGLAEVLCGPD